MGSYLVLLGHCNLGYGERAWESEVFSLGYPTP
jgi:hypothetical protein